MNKLIKWFLDLFKRKSKWVTICSSHSPLFGYGVRVYIDNIPGKVLKVDHKVPWAVPEVVRILVVARNLEEVHSLVEGEGNTVAAVGADTVADFDGEIIGKAEDAEDAEQWLLNKQLIFPEHKPSWKLRAK